MNLKCVLWGGSFARLKKFFNSKIRDDYSKDSRDRIVQIVLKVRRP